MNRTLEPVYKDHLASPDVTESMGIIWLPGRDGRDGTKGERGVAGPPGSRGEKGEIGPSGTDTDHRNWEQCAWKNHDTSDIGLIKVR